MAADLLIVGQGLAGTLLAWACEQARVPFELADAGPAGATTAAGAGIVNPVTGRRLVKSWRVAELLPAARATYREIEHVLGVPLWRGMRIHRRLADDAERAALARKLAAGELAPHVTADGPDACWIDDAARVDFGRLLAASRARWRAAGRLRAGRVEPRAETERYRWVIDCTGTDAARAGRFGFVPWEFSQGELLELAEAGLAPDVIVHRRHWVVPTGEGTALVGATHQPGVTDPAPTAAGRGQLEAAARELLGRPAVRVVGHRSGVRVTLPDRRPVAGWHPRHRGLGLINGLGAKGALWAPLLARAMTLSVLTGRPVEPEVAVDRFWPGGAS